MFRAIIIERNFGKENRLTRKVKPNEECLFFPKFPTIKRLLVDCLDMDEICA